MTGKIKLVHSGGNAVSIAVPTSNPSSSEVEFKLPQSDASSSGQALVSDGSGNLSFASVAGGKILQVLSTTKTDTFSTASTSQVDITGFSVSITPSSSSNKVLVSGFLTTSISTTALYALRFYLLRGSTAICIHDTAGNRSRCTFGTQGIYSGDSVISFPFEFLDSPSTTNAVTYKIQVQSEAPQTIYINRASAETDGDNVITPRYTSTISVKEVAA